MTIADMRETMRNLNNELDQARTRARELYGNPNASAEEMDAQASIIRQLNARIELVRDDIAGQERGQSQTLSTQQPAQESSCGTRLGAMLRSNEYARAFAAAVRNGVTLKTGRGQEAYNVLFDALTVGGGDPAGTDGGFLVPEDVATRINEIRRSLNPLSELFSVETVTALKGWRVMDNFPSEGMKKVEEMAAIDNKDKPAFSRITYALDKFGLMLPISNELAEYEEAGLFNYLSRWFAKKGVLTENAMLLALLNSLTPNIIEASSEINQIKHTLNVDLDPAISLNAALVTNQSGFDLLDNLEDKNGRPLLMENPKDPTQQLFKGRPIKVMSDKVLPNVDNAGQKAPLFVGDCSQLATLFRRNTLEIKSTDVGGDAWKTDSIEMRGLAHMGVSKFDTAAVCYRQLTLA